MTAGGYPYPPRSPLHKAQALRKARTRFAGESRNCFPRTWALRQGMKIAVRFSLIPLRPSGAVQDGMHRTSFVRAYPSLGFRLAASPTGRARLRPPSFGRSSQWHLQHYVCRYLLFTGLPVHFRLRRMPHRGTIHLRPTKAAE